MGSQEHYFIKRIGRLYRLERYSAPQKRIGRLYPYRWLVQSLGGEGEAGDKK